MDASQRPVIALFTGDPAGIGPELVAKLLQDAQAMQSADVLLIGQRGQEVGVAKVAWHDWAGRDAAAFAPGQAQADNGRYMLQGLAAGVDLVLSGRADAFCFAPLNKSALRAGGMHQEDELRWFAEYLDFTGECGELNVLRNLWTARVTSHVALRDVSDLLSPQKVANAIRMIGEALRAAGVAQPRLATRRAVSSHPASHSPRSRAMPPTGPSLPTPRSCGRCVRRADMTVWSRCTTTRVRSR
jgi:4-hydroxy-L-threonine phosphate dehydrogenase PdxA